MARRWIPHPQERIARRYRRAQDRRDRESVGRYGPGGFGYPEGYRGAYAERREYATPRGELYPPRPGGRGLPSPLRQADHLSEERRLRALRDRDLARTTDNALFSVLGPEADQIAVYADDAVITLEGRVSGPRAAREALEVAWHVPGVYRVRNGLRWWRR